MTDENQSKSHQRSQINNIIIGGLAIVIVAAASFAAYMVWNQTRRATDTPATTSTDSSTAAQTPTTVVPKTAIESVPVTPGTPEEGATWHKPQALPDLKLITITEGLSGNDNHYYSVGTTKDGEDIITAEIWGEGPVIVPDLFRFIKKTDAYYLITHNSPDMSQWEPSPLATVVKQDTTTTFSELEPEKTITKQSTKLTYVYNNGIRDVPDFGAPKQIGTTKLGTLFMITGTVAPQDTLVVTDAVSKAVYYVVLADGSKAFYESRPTFMKDDGTLSATWTNNAGNGATFAKLHYGGCGLGGGLVPIVGKVDYLTGKSEVGASASSKLYIVADQNNTLLKYLYGIYKDTRTNDPAEASKVVPIDQYVAKLGFVLWADDYGSTLVFQNSDYAELAECGKPVVYLYPTREMNISVKVGASITKSDPAYGTGWNVVAKPDGTLTSGARTYPYLFWEGLGLGQYPAILSGVVVPRASVEQRIRSDLTYIGLNNKEVQDFVDFWMPKMPSSAYVRLSWLQNKEMNSLAPLAISPKPDTTIRVFLDFAGLASKTNIPVQALQHYVRQGFTVVEWGGLLKR